MSRFIGRLSLAIAADIAFISVAEPGIAMSFVFGFLMGIWVACAEVADK